MASWTLTKAHWKRLESFRLRCQRRMLSIKWSDFITNAEVCTRWGLQSIQLMVRQRRLLLFGHIVHIRIMYRPKQFCTWHATSDTGVSPFPNCRRPWGHRPISWLHQICSECGLSAVPIIGPCGERTLWPPQATTMTTRLVLAYGWQTTCKKGVVRSCDPFYLTTLC